MGDGYDMTDLLKLAVSERVEKMQLHAGQLPQLTIRGEVYPIEGPIISPENAEALLGSLAGTRQIREFRERNAISFIHNFQDGIQFRVQAKSEDSGIQMEIVRLAV